VTEYGAPLRPLWGIDPDFLTVNHGSFGATPHCVLEAQTRWRTQMEAQPSRFMRRELGPALRDAASHLAAFVGAPADDLVFVDNATGGCNAILRSLELSRGDEIVVFDHGYAAVRNAVTHVANGAGATIVTAVLPFPEPNDDAILTALRDALTVRTRLVIVDHITSPSAVVMPLVRLIATCRDAGVPILVDGAHGPGHVSLDLSALAPDYYTGNCHKWLCAPKGCAFLYVRRDRQRGVHPLTISHGYGQGFLTEFDWTGTTDFSAFLAVTDAIAFHERLGGAALRLRNTELAAEASRRVAARLGTETSSPATPAAAMSLVRLPTVSSNRVECLRDAFLDARTDAPLHVLSGSIWVRLSAHAYNQIEDYECLSTLLERCLTAVG
jgi:isopenicillin-N epimerase